MRVYKDVLLEMFHVIMVVMIASWGLGPKYASNPLTIRTAKFIHDDLRGPVPQRHPSQEIRDG